MQKNKVLQNNVIRRDDLERYEIIIPFLNITGRRRKQFLCSELEKMHPCFSDEFTFDSVIKKLCKKGICEDVFVMNKYKLAEYERKRHFSGAGFFVEKELRGKRRLFVDQKWRLTLYAIIACVILGIAGIVFSALGVNRGTVNKGTVNKNEVVSVPENSSRENITVTDISQAIRLFEIAQEADGKICSFDWRIEQKDGVLLEKLNACIKGVFPEALAGISNAHVPGDKTPVETVLYEEGVPRISIASKNALAVLKGVAEVSAVSIGSVVSEVLDEAVLSNADFNKAIRGEIVKHGGSLKEEKAPPYHIDFICKTDSSDSLKQTKEMLQKLNEIIGREKRLVTSISIIPDGVTGLRVGLSIENSAAVAGTKFTDTLTDAFSDSFTEKCVVIDLQNICQNLELFIERMELPEYNTFALKNNSIQLEHPENNYKKIGEIKRADNRTVVYYKAPDGKIKSVEKW